MYVSSTVQSLVFSRWLLLRTHQLPVSSFVSALKLMKVEGVDNDEAECIIANLIYEVRVCGIFLCFNSYTFDCHILFSPHTRLTVFGVVAARLTLAIR